jgi:hypothetical protein
MNKDILKAKFIISYAKFLLIKSKFISAIYCIKTLTRHVERGHKMECFEGYKNLVYCQWMFM